MIKDRFIEFILIILEQAAHALGFGLVPLEQAQALDNAPIAYSLP